jgi:putative membrane protein
MKNDGGPAMRQLFDSFAGFDDFLIYLAVALAILGLYVAIYIRVTPQREIALIRAGNMAAAYSLSGAVIGFVIPLASAIQHSVSLVDMAIWGLIAMLIQLGAFVVVKLCIPGIGRDITENQAAQGLFLGAVSIAVGILNAACMSY